MTCYGSNFFFCQKSGGWIFNAKVQNHPGSSKIDGSLRKIKNIPLKAATTKWELIRVSQGVYYLCGGVFLTFRFRVSATASQKTSIRHSKNRKSTFCGTKWKCASVAFLAIPRATRLSDMALFRQTMPWSWPTLAHFTKSCNLERGRSFLWRDFLLNYISQGLNFFPHLGDIKWPHTKVSHFLIFLN
jgi:hypothetical protein